MATRKVSSRELDSEEEVQRRLNSLPTQLCQSLKVPDTSAPVWGRRTHLELPKAALPKVWCREQVHQIYPVPTAHLKTTILEWGLCCTSRNSYTEKRWPKEFPIKNIPHRTVYIRGQQGEMPSDINLTLSFVSSYIQGSRNSCLHWSPFQNLLLPLL